MMQKAFHFALRYDSVPKRGILTKWLYSPLPLFAILSLGLVALGACQKKIVSMQEPNPIQPVALPKEPSPESMLLDIHFNYGEGSLSNASVAILEKDAEVVKTMFRDSLDVTVVIEGHCDERSSAEYNLGLADQRATRVKEFLVTLGLPAERLEAIGFGKERPQCVESTEDCGQRNRRVHLVARLY